MKQKPLAARREFVRRAGSAAVLANLPGHGWIEILSRQSGHQPDYTLRIAARPIEMAKKNIVSAVTL